MLAALLLNRDDLIAVVPPPKTAVYEGSTARLARELLNEDFFVMPKVDFDDEDLMVVLQAFMRIRR